jgi:GDSL-like Lipase/Acylhydrolase family
MLHTRMRWLIVAVALVAMLATTLLAGPALRSTRAASGPPPPYLALGDSVAFGYSPQVDPSDPHNFSGYPTPAARALKESLTNAACPGETSSHFIDLTGSDNGCGAFRANDPLHVAYSGTQLAFADSFLTSHPTTQLVSINIGANDLFVLQRTCAGDITCIQANLLGMLNTLATNLNIIYNHIRTLDGYKNQLVALTYYSLNYSSANSAANSIIMALNNVVAQVTVAWGGKVADGYGAFAAIATAAFGFDSCAARLLIEVSSSPLSCNIHPSYPGDNGLESHADTGRDVLGQAIVNALRTD